VYREVRSWRCFERELGLFGHGSGRHIGLICWNWFGLGLRNHGFSASNDIAGNLPPRAVGA
jgi:hypothetical protein